MEFNKLKERYIMYHTVYVSTNTWNHTVQYAFETRNKNYTQLNPKT
jgi:hypothetical protein